MRRVDYGERYLGEVRRALQRIEDLGVRFDLCLYNAGMDPFEACTTGGLAGITVPMLAERERMVFECCRRLGLPVAFVLAGGYTGPDLDQAGLVQLHRLTLSAAMGAAAR